MIGWQLEREPEGPRAADPDADDPDGAASGRSLKHFHNGNILLMIKSTKTQGFYILTKTNNHHTSCIPLHCQNKIRYDSITPIHHIASVLGMS